MECFQEGASVIAAHPSPVQQGILAELSDPVNSFA
jgi:hypothetical protein